MKPRVLLQTISAILFTIFFTAAAFAQADQARVAGNVTDVNGAVIVCVTVKVTNEQTGETRTVTAGDDGAFRVVALKPSIYTIAASAANFETTTKKGDDGCGKHNERVRTWISENTWLFGARIVGGSHE